MGRMACSVPYIKILQNFNEYCSYNALRYYSVPKFHIENLLDTNVSLPVTINAFKRKITISYEQSACLTICVITPNHCSIP